MPPESKIIVLEDDPRRINEMRAAIRGIDVEFEILFFDNAHRLCQWLEKHSNSVSLISLDHDLDTTTVMEQCDAGTGEQVVDWLITNHCTIPVVIHSSNAMRAPALHLKLAMAGWTKLKLAPFSSATQWIDDVSSIL